MTDVISEIDPKTGLLIEYEVRVISSFWARIFAMLLDMIFLGAVGFIIGTLFTQQLVELGYYARSIGLVIVLFYFGIMNSRIGQGQTFGKRIMHIRVLNREGHYISVKKAFLRILILEIPFYLNGISLVSTIWLYAIYSFVIGGIGFSIFYLYIFNRKTRQSFHDLICGTYVVRDNLNGIIVSDPIGRIHYFVVITAFLACLFIPFFIVGSYGKLFNELYTAQNDLSKIHGILNTSVSEGENYSDGKKPTYGAVSVSIKDKASKDIIVQNIAKRIVESGHFLGKDYLGVIIIYGYDIGIWSYYEKQNYWHTRQEWKELNHN